MMRPHFSHEVCMLAGLAGMWRQCGVREEGLAMLQFYADGQRKTTS